MINGRVTLANTVGGWCWYTGDYRGNSCSCCEWRHDGIETIWCAHQRGNWWQGCHLQLQQSIENINEPPTSTPSSGASGNHDAITKVANQFAADAATTLAALGYPGEGQWGTLSATTAAFSKTWSLIAHRAGRSSRCVPCAVILPRSKYFEKYRCKQKQSQKQANYK